MNSDWPLGEFLDGGGRKRRGSTGVDGGWRLWALWWSVSGPVVPLWWGTSSLTLKPGKHTVVCFQKSNVPVWSEADGLKCGRLRSRSFYILFTCASSHLQQRHRKATHTEQNHRSAWLTVRHKSINDNCLHKHTVSRTADVLLIAATLIDNNRAESLRIYSLIILTSL